MFATSQTALLEVRRIHRMHTIPFRLKVRSIGRQRMLLDIRGKYAQRMEPSLVGVAFVDVGCVGCAREAEESMNGNR